MLQEKHEQKMWRKLNLTFKIYLPLSIHVGKAVVWGARPNSFCELSFGHSHHGAQSMLLKKLSDVVKYQRAKMAKEIKSNQSSLCVIGATSHTWVVPATDSLFGGCA
jgi:hypothetical protein